MDLAASRREIPPVSPVSGESGLASWARATGRGRRAEPRAGGLRFAFYGRVSTEDHQEPDISRARQLALASGLVAGYMCGEMASAGQPSGHLVRGALAAEPRDRSLRPAFQPAPASGQHPEHNGQAPSARTCLGGPGPSAEEALSCSRRCRLWDRQGSSMHPR